MSWATIRTGMEAAINNIASLTVHPVMKDTLPEKNVAVVLPGEPLLAPSGHHNKVDVNIRVVVRVNRATAEDCQEALDAYVWPAGASSVQTAVEADNTLGGAVDDVQFQRVSNYGPSEGEQGKWQADVLFRAKVTA